MELIPPRPLDPSRARLLLDGLGGFPASDEDLFLSGYDELCRIDLSGGHAVEICGGAGKLAAAMARVFPSAKVTGIDLYAACGPEVESQLARCPNLEYLAGDAFDLSRFEDSSVDLIWGQAALHHLSHNLKGLGNECARVLKPGGRLVFIFEPLGHNPVVAAIRAIRMARHELGDESNLYLSQLARLGESFARTEVHAFNLFGYLMKGMPKSLSPLVGAVKGVDRGIFGMFPGLVRYAANCNVVFTR